MKAKTIELSMIIWKEAKWYVATCPQLEVTSQGKTVDEAKKNLKEAVELYLEGERDVPAAQPHPLYTCFDVSLPVRKR